MSMRLVKLVVLMAALFSGVTHATNWSTQTHDLYPGDFDGDGRDDLLVIAKDQGGFSGIFTSATGGAPSTQLQSWNSGFLGINWHSGSYTAIVGDFNGDNRDDVFLQRATGGNSFLLHANSEGKLYAIHQVIADSHLSLGWAQDQRRIVAGDFNGDGKDELFLQAKQSSGTHAIVAANSSGHLTSISQSWANNHLGFKWSTVNAVVHVGDFNGDNRDDLLIQAKPEIILIDYEIPIPVPVYKPQSFGLTLATASGQFTSIHQLWSRKDFGADWAPVTADIVIGDFNGDQRDDVMLVARATGQPSYIMLANSNGQISSSPAQTLSPGSLGTNWTVAEYRMLAADFTGDGRAELYRQATATSGTNDIASFTSSGTVSTVTTHNAPSVTNGMTTAVGRMPGEFAVDANGAATYEIPIDVPEGTNGLAPSLALSYSSSSDGGPLGVGWGVSGFSAIVRCPRSLDQDGETRGVELNANDRFCLDGNKLRTTGGSYGANNTTYQTEIDVFSRVTSYTTGGAGYTPSTGPQYFRVEGKDGLYYFYGSTEDARIEVKGTTVPRAWALNRVEDRNGNYLTISYVKGTDGGGAFNGSYRPSVIEWARTAAGAGPYFKTVFVYENRPASDVDTGYFAGGAITEDKRLDRLEVQAYENSAWGIVRQYDVTYESTLPSTGRSRVASITQCSATECLPATTFQYQNGAVGWSSTEITSSSASSAKMEYAHALDIDGDARSDLVYPQDGTWWFMRATVGGGFWEPTNTGIAAGGDPNPPYAYALEIDAYSDGRPGVLVNIPGYSTLQILRWNGTTLERTSTTLTMTLEGKEWVADFDGDNREDLLKGVQSGTSLSFSVYRNSGALAPAAPQFDAAQTFYSTSLPAGYNLSAFGNSSTLGAPTQHSYRVIDVNVDGKADFIYGVSGATNCYTYTAGVTLCDYYYNWHSLISTGTSFTASTSWGCAFYGMSAAPSPQCAGWPLMGDFNGDGVSDVAHPNGTSSPTWQLRLGAGKELSATATDTGASAVPTGQAYVADYDNDGRSDIVFAPSAGTTLQVLRSNGSGFDAPVSTGVPSGSENSSIRVLDIDGDGQLDIGYKNASYRVRKHSGVAPDLLTRVTDGFGNFAAPTYAALTDSTVYTKGTGATYPDVDLQIPVDVVKQFTTSTGIASPATYDVNFKYEGFRAHLRGRGYLGFKKRITTDGRAGNEIRIEEVFSQTFPHAGMPLSVTTFQPNSSTRISEVTNVLAETVLDNTANNQRRFSYIQSTTEDKREISAGYSGTLVSRVTTTSVYDNYGNLTNQTAIVTDMQSDSELLNATYQVQLANTFDFASYPQMLSNWCIGASTRAEIRSTTPGLPQSSPRVKTFTYDYPKCRLTEEIVEPNNPGDNTKVTTAFAYYASGPSIGQLESETVTGVAAAPAPAPLPRTTTYEYHPAGPYVTKATNPVGQFATAEWRIGLGVQTRLTDINGVIVNALHDSLGRVIRETRPDGTQADVSYLSCQTGCGYSTGKYQVVTSQSGGGTLISQSAAVFDQLDRSLQSTRWLMGGAQSHSITEYDQMGRVLRTSAPFWTGGTVYWAMPTYDLLGRPLQEQHATSETDATLQTTAWSYMGLRTQQTDPEGKTITKWSNAIGQVVRMIDAASGTTRYAYDQFGNLTSTTDPGSNQFTAAYNIRGFKVSSNDVDVGAWSYKHNSLGELVSQLDANGQTVSLTYDKLGRLTRRTEVEGITDWTYDTAPNGKGMLHTVTAPNSYSQTYSYDSLGRPSSQTTSIDSVNYLVSLAYNAQGQVDTITYPESHPSSYRFKIRYVYDHGMVKRVEDANGAGTVYWNAVDTNPSGAVTTEMFGNGVGTSSWYDAVNGLLRERYSGPGYNGAVQSLTYQWDRVGNLKQRRDVSQNLTENFFYDNLHRLDYSNLNTVQNLDVSYDSLGNISSMYREGTSSPGTYTYHSTKKHAVVSTSSGMSFSYDNNGNMTSRNGSAITWYSNNLPKKLNKGANSSEFFYDADQARYKGITTENGAAETTIYIGSLFERVTKDGAAIQYKHHIPGAGGAAAVHNRRSNGVYDTRYLHKDHLGSVDTVTNESGTVLVRMSYDAFGKRRNAQGWQGIVPATDWTQINAITHRGFTSHEMLDAVDLVHMNGRVYDPMAGRFISADPFVQSPLNSQSLNRYSYVWNNPLSATDPSGYFSLKKALKSLNKFHRKPTLRNFFHAVRNLPFQDKIDRYVMNHKWAYNLGFAVATAFTAWGGGFGGAVFASYYSYQATGSMTAAVTTLVVVAAMNYVTGQVVNYAGGGGAGGGWNQGINGPILGINTGVGAEASSAVSSSYLDQLLLWFRIGTRTAKYSSTVGKLGTTQNVAGTLSTAAIAGVGPEAIRQLNETIVRTIDASQEILSKKTKWARTGELGEQLAREYLIANGYIILGSQVYVRTSAGLRVTDFIVTGGKLGADIAGFEVKVNGATRSSLQIIKDDLIATQGGTVASWRQANFDHGVPIRYTTYLMYVDLEVK